jgi:hypothetical protein
VNRMQIWLVAFLIIFVLFSLLIPISRRSGYAKG